MGRLRAVLPREKQCANEMQNSTWALLRAEVRGTEKHSFQG